MFLYFYSFDIKLFLQIDTLYSWKYCWVGALFGLWDYKTQSRNFLGVKKNGKNEY